MNLTSLNLTLDGFKVKLLTYLSCFKENKNEV